MKTLLFSILLLFSFDNAFIQTQWYTRNNINSPLDFLTPRDSIKNLYPINKGAVYIGNDTLDLKNIHKMFFSNFYKGHVESYYLLLDKNNDSLKVVLHFAYSKLFEIAIYAKGKLLFEQFKT